MKHLSIRSGLTGTEKPFLLHSCCIHVHVALRKCYNLMPNKSTHLMQLGPAYLCDQGRFKPVCLESSVESILKFGMSLSKLIAILCYQESI